MQGNRILKRTLLGIALGAALVVVASPAAFAQCYGGHCYYGPSYYGPGYFNNFQHSFYKDWSYSPQIKGYYCQFGFKPYAAYNGYLNHYCVYYPDRYAGKAYYFDPLAKCYYGCYDYQAKGFCLLAAADRHATLAETPAAAFGKPGPLPKVGDLAPPAPDGGLGAALIGENPAIQAPPALPAVEPQKDGIVAPPQVSGTDLPPGTPDPMTNPIPPPISQ